MRLFNTLTKKLEEFAPLNPPEVRLYTCGPTVYSFMTIGNWRAFVFDDILRRVLAYKGFLVNHVMNVTDVGHLSGDNLGHADTGEDRLEKGAKREGKTVWEVAQFYLDDFIISREKLNIIAPTTLARATDYIKEQIDLVSRLVEGGYGYETDSAVFFDVEKFPEYGKLGGQKLIDKRTAARDEVLEDPTKKHPQDFALWLKTVGKFADHQMRWPSPWGEGFPGWHVECSAMAMSLLGETLDIHTGGIDHIAIHHTNEIAQSEAASGKEFSRYWLHNEFLTVDGGRMGKSLGNAYTMQDILAKKIDPLALRYFYLSAHYRALLNFTWEGLEGAQTALKRLRHKVGLWQAAREDDQEGSADDYRQSFETALFDDLNLPKALAVVWQMAEDPSVGAKEKLDALLKFDEVLGLDLGREEKGGSPVMTEEVKALLIKREQLRAKKQFDQADAIRDDLLKRGLIIEDTK